MIFGCFLGITCMAIGPEAIRLLGGDKYLEGKQAVVPITLGVVCQYVYTHYVNIEMHLKKTQYVSAGTVVAAVLNIVLNIIFIPRFGFAAAAYTTLAGYIVLMLLHYLITKFVFKIHLYDDGFMFAVMPAAGILGTVLFLLYDHIVIRYMFFLVLTTAYFVVNRNLIMDFIRKRKKT